VQSAAGGAAGDLRQATSVSRLSPVNAPSAAERASQDTVGADSEKAVENQRRTREEQLIQNEIKLLAARDREVRAHEQAHMAAGGQYAGAASYQYQRGPNGVSYAVGGEVPISTSKEATPEATLRKAQIIRRAALAPAEPSPQDRKVAAMATQMESAARVELAREFKVQKEQAEPTTVEAKQEAQSDKPEADSAERPSKTSPDNESARERLQRRISSLDGSAIQPAGTLFSLMI
jgi:hypothetical protein